jgi:hypothetical protein
MSRATTTVVGSPPISARIAQQTLRILSMWDLVDLGRDLAWARRAMSALPFASSHLIMPRPS